MSDYSFLKTAAHAYLEDKMSDISCAPCLDEGFETADSIAEKSISRQYGEPNTTLGEDVYPTKSIQITERVKKLANDFTHGGETTQSLAQKYNLSKSTVSRDLSKRILRTNLSSEIKNRVSNILQDNFNKRGIRAGLVAKYRYEKIQQL